MKLVMLHSNLTRPAFLLTNPISDLVNPDCLNLRVIWNEHLRKTVLADYVCQPD